MDGVVFCAFTFQFISYLRCLSFDLKKLFSFIYFLFSLWNWMGKRKMKHWSKRLQSERKKIKKMTQNEAHKKRNEYCLMSWNDEQLKIVVVSCCWHIWIGNSKMLKELNCCKMLFYWIIVTSLNVNFNCKICRRKAKNEKNENNVVSFIPFIHSFTRFLLFVFSCFFLHSKHSELNSIHRQWNNLGIDTLIQTRRLCAIKTILTMQRSTKKKTKFTMHSNLK